MFSSPLSSASISLRKRLIPVAAVTAALALTGCASQNEPAATTAPTSSQVTAEASPTAAPTPTLEALDVDGIYADLARELIENPEQLYTYYAAYYQQREGKEYRLDGSTSDGGGYAYPIVSTRSGAGTWRFWRDAPKEQWGQLMTYHWVEPGSEEQKVLIITFPENISEASNYGAGAGHPLQAWFAIDREAKKPYMLRVSMTDPAIIDGHLVYTEMIGSGGSGALMEEFTYAEDSGRFTSTINEVPVEQAPGGNLLEIRWTTSTGSEVSFGQIREEGMHSGSALSELAK